MRRQEVLTITVQMILHVERVVVVGCARRILSHFWLGMRGGWPCALMHKRLCQIRRSEGKFECTIIPATGRGNKHRSLGSTRNENLTVFSIRSTFRGRSRHAGDNSSPRIARMGG
jgi:hypothetical protein